MNLSPDFDSGKAEAFENRFLNALNSGALCLMASIGHRTGLFDVMSQFEPATSEEIAVQAGLNERYVREWLGAMATAGVVEVNPATGNFTLPPEHAACLTRAAAADNMAVFTQYVGLLGAVEDDIVECFKHGGGVPYEKYPRFHAVMSEDSGQSVLSSLEAHIVPLVPDLASRLSSGIKVLDVGCGRGMIVSRLAELYPNSNFTGLDLSQEAIEFARNLASQKGLQNTQFKVADLSDFHKTTQQDAFDFITTFDAVHDQAKPLNAERHIPGTEKRRHQSDAGYQGIEPCPQQPGTPDRHLSLHHLMHALYDRLTGPRWGRSGRNVGGGNNPPIPPAGRLQLNRDP